MEALGQRSAREELIVQKTYSPISADQLVKFREEANANGIAVPSGNSGQLIAHGCTLAFSYDGTNLGITILSKPFYIPASAIWSSLDPYLA